VPTLSRVPQEVTREEGDGGAMEGIEREGLFTSQHATGLDAPVPTLAPARTEGGGKKDKGKAKAVLITAPPGAAASRKLKGSPQQLQRQAAVDEARKKAETHTQTPEVGASAPACLRSILKRPETAAAEAEAMGKREEEKRKAEERRVEDARAVATREEVRWEEREKREEEKLARKVEAQSRWEARDLTREEWKVYGNVANLIKALPVSDEDGEKAAQRIAHLAGMRAVEELWQEGQDPRIAPPPQRALQQLRQRQQQVRQWTVSRDPQAVL